MIARSEQLRDRSATFGQEGSDFTMSEIRRFMEWLSFHPTTDDIARALVTDFLVGTGVQAMRFGRINSDDSALVLGQYGYTDAENWHDLIVPGPERRAWDLPITHIITGKNDSIWAPDSKLCVVALRDHGVIQGNAVFEFASEVLDQEKDSVIEVIGDLCLPIALYLSFLNQHISSAKPQSSIRSETFEVGIAELSNRQKLILRGMVEGKTNHELALQLGYSVSTIRHETMRIYQSLSVSDRKEAAKKAVMLSLI